MIKESIKELISAIAEGDTIAIEDSFNSVMSYKIADRLDSMRVDVAQTMFGSVVEESVDELDESAINAAKKETPELFPKDGESLSDYKKRMSDKRIASSEKNKSFIKKTFAKEEVDKMYEELIDEESDPTGVKIYHTDKAGKAGSHIVFTSQDANRFHSQIKKAGGKVTHHALMFGTKEGEKKSLSEEVEYMDESHQVVKKLKKEYDSHMNKYNAAPFGSSEAAMHNKNAEKVMDKINIAKESSK
jgi:hypothetical protein